MSSSPSFSPTPAPNFKIVLLGPSAAGKTAILMRYTRDVFSSSFISTIGVDFRVHTVKIGSKPVRLQVWDTAGQERFRAATSGYFRGAHGAVLVADVRRPASFVEAESFLKEFREHEPFTPVAFAANKIDDETERLVSSEAVLEAAAKLGIPPDLTFEVSAKDRTNIWALFEAIALQCVDTMMPTTPRSSVHISGDDPDTEDSSCCSRAKRRPPPRLAQPLRAWLNSVNIPTAFDQIFAAAKAQMIQDLTLEEWTELIMLDDFKHVDDMELPSLAATQLKKALRDRATERRSSGGTPPPSLKLPSAPHKSSPLRSARP